MKPARAWINAQDYCCVVDEVGTWILEYCGPWLVVAETVRSLNIPIRREDGP